MREIVSTGENTSGLGIEFSGTERAHRAAAWPIFRLFISPTEDGRHATVHCDGKVMAGKVITDTPIHTSSSLRLSLNIDSTTVWYFFVVSLLISRALLSLTKPLIRRFFTKRETLVRLASTVVLVCSSTLTYVVLHQMMVCTHDAESSQVEQLSDLRNLSSSKRKEVMKEFQWNHGSRIF